MLEDGEKGAPAPAFLDLTSPSAKTQERFMPAFFTRLEPTKLAIFAGFEGDHALATFATFVNVTVFALNGSSEKRPTTRTNLASIITMFACLFATHMTNSRISLHIRSISCFRFS